MHRLFCQMGSKYCEGTFSMHSAPRYGVNWASNIFVGITALVLCACTRAQTVVNLLGTGNNVTYGSNTYPGADSGEINEAIFRLGAQGAGTGLFYPFLRLNGTAVERGYNTSSRPLVFDEDASWTKKLQLYQVPYLWQGGKRYFVFNLDVNEPNNINRYLSLDQVKIYTHPTEPATPPTNPDFLGTLRYEMDAGNTQNRVLLNGNYSSGSGSSDMEMLVPVDLFGGANTDVFVFLYSVFGELGAVNVSPGGTGSWANHSGFEEWAVYTAPPPPGIFFFPPGYEISVVPEPREWSFLIGMGLVGVALWRRWRNPR